MRTSNSFFITRREYPSDEESDSAKLLVKSGMILKNSNGIYTYLPFGFKVFENVKKIIREEFNNINANEVLMPTLIPSRYFEVTQRKKIFDKEMFNITSSDNKEYSLCPTSEELFAYLARNRIQSYKDLHFTLYQISNKYRDEIKTEYGLIRKKEFTMADAYSFDANDGGSDISYDKMYLVFKNIFTKFGLSPITVRSDSSYMKGLSSEEFQVISKYGDNEVVKCKKCTYASNIEEAECKNSYKISVDNRLKKQLVKTPNIKSIFDLSNYLHIKEKNILKSIICRVDGVYKMFLLRGSSELNISKVKKLFKTNNIEIPSSYELEKMSTTVGYIGPINCTLEIIADNEVKTMTNFVCGSNKENYHYLNVNIDDDFKVNRYADIKVFDSASLCPKCKSECEIVKGIEIGHIFKLGDNYSKEYSLKYLDEKNEINYVHMGSYGIGVDRCISAIVESHHDYKGIIWPMNVAPFKVAIVVVNINDKASFKYSKELYEKLNKLGIDTLLDDRKESVGIKFSDMDLLGIPIRITVGRDFENNEVEFKLRKDDHTECVKTKDLIDKIKKEIEAN